ncbi:hypothetical protein SAY87_016255 [Trapa incisa]|uniref:AB hydrolase-1 domain-containing protein n=1 Tax=Trapa incisa TaxID=236973 RepID=A0AAN7L9P7_9MYRT|nr:hypothetical protein SAY87_016255 [Trapa incisa]
MGMVFNTPQQVSSPQNTELEDYPPVKNSLRVKLSDGRYLAYAERGVPLHKSKYRIIIVHGFGSSKEMNFPVSQELIEELGIYFLLFDRAGYGDSDLNMKRSVESEALDIQQLADKLELGSNFYVIGVSMGSYPTWGCLRYIPHRLAGVALVVPIVNYWWPSLPKSLTKLDFRKKLIYWTLQIASHAPSLLHWWVTKKCLPSNSVVERDPTFFNEHDMEVLKNSKGFPMLTRERLRHKEVFHTLRTDFMACFGKWDFDPLEMVDPFPEEDERKVHIWQGNEDKVVPVDLQRCISQKLPWIRYHEIPQGGHLIVHYDGVCDTIVKALLIGEEPHAHAEDIPDLAVNGLLTVP